MKVRDLIQQWEEHASQPLTNRIYCINLPLEDAARLHALAELYPRRRLEDLLSDLIRTALDEVEEALPYMPGSKVIAEDDQGDPIYEDAGPTARLRVLTNRFVRELGAERGRDGSSSGDESARLRVKSGS